MKAVSKSYVKDWENKKFDETQAPEGMPFPKNIELEEAVLGAIMVDQSAMLKVKDLLKPKHFYKPEHQLIYEAQVSLFENGKPIDIITVVERLMERNTLKAAGGPAQVTEISNRVASSANLEYHGRILYELHLRREGYKLAINAAHKMLDRQHDIFDVRDELAKESMVTPFNNLFLFRSLTEVMIEAEKQPDTMKMAGHLFRKGEVSILFAAAGVGKSIFSMQIADSLSKGEEVLRDVLVNETDPQKVLYFDFELTDRNILNRYSDKATGQRYEFSDNLIHVGFNPDFLDYDAKLDKLVAAQMESAIIQHNPEIVIIDNITFLVAESPTDPEVAMRLMKKMMFYKRRYDLSILVLAHSPKRNKTQPIEQKDLAGSAQLSNFADSVWAIGESDGDAGIRYIKQVKARNGLIYDRDNVISIFIEKDVNSMLRMHFNEFGREDDYLASFLDHDTQDNMIEDAIKIRIREPLKSWEKIKNEIGWMQSRASLMLKCQQYATSSKQYEFNPKEKTFSVSNESITPDNEWEEGRDMLGSENDKEDLPF